MLFFQQKQPPPPHNLSIFYNQILSSSTECQGGIHRNSKPYKSAPNDVWSLGVILINLTAGRNPWKQASVKDDTFNAYLQNPDFLLSILPITTELNEIIKRIFCINPDKRIRLHELRRQIASCRHFTRLSISHESSTAVPLPIPETAARACAKPRTPPQSPICEEEEEEGAAATIPSPLSLDMPATPTYSCSLDEVKAATTNSTLSSSSWQSIGGADIATATTTPTATFDLQCRITLSASTKDEPLPTMQTGTVPSDRRFEQDHHGVDLTQFTNSVFVNSYSFL